MIPRKGFTKKLAYFVTDYGSIHTDFQLEGQTFRAPAGVAHYLEHKMFDMPGGRDVSEEFAALGASTQRLHQLRHDRLLFLLHGPF